MPHQVILLDEHGYKDRKKKQRLYTASVHIHLASYEFCSKGKERVPRISFSVNNLWLNDQVSLQMNYVTRGRTHVNETKPPKLMKINSWLRYYKIILLF